QERKTWCRTGSVPVSGSYRTKAII
ncbi:site-specific DNA-methyltransferase, partial [Shigella flexneri]|nr:site-specific DNA-methyltransferase [Shigella flexneri]